MSGSPMVTTRQGRLKGPWSCHQRAATSSGTYAAQRLATSSGGTNAPRYADRTGPAFHAGTTGLYIGINDSPSIARLNLGSLASITMKKRSSVARAKRGLLKHGW